MVGIDLSMVKEAFGLFKKLGQDNPDSEALFKRFTFLYTKFGEPEKEELFSAIINQIEVNKKSLEPVISLLMKCSGEDRQWPVLLSNLRNTLYSPRMKSLRTISRYSGGLKFLLDFRGDLVSIRRHAKNDLSPLDSDIVFLFEMWFQDGFLYLEEITLDSSYRQIDIIRNSDLVHPMAGIEEMGKRLGKDRRCFALYHRLLPLEPVIFIEVALCEGIVKNVSDIMAGAGKTNGEIIDTAIFYSINNTQNGLSGLGLGKMLIGKVVEYLKKENEHIKNFATLSPVPGFWKKYLKPVLEGKDDHFSMKSADIISFFPGKSVGSILEASGSRASDVSSFNKALISILSGDNWVKNNDLAEILRVPMTKIAYHYISAEKNSQNKPLNPVAGFHLGNGAAVSIKNVNFLANTSEKGMKESCGIMVNYVYSLKMFGSFMRSFKWLERFEIKTIFSRKHH